MAIKVGSYLPIPTFQKQIAHAVEGHDVKSINLLFARIEIEKNEYSARRLYIAHRN